MTRSKFQWLLCLGKTLLGFYIFLFELCESQVVSSVSIRWDSSSSSPGPVLLTAASSQDFSVELQPQIHSPHLRITVQRGDRIALPCKVHNLGENHILWRHGTNILAGSNVSSYSDDRIRLLPDFTLELSRVSLGDEGDYECVVTAWPPLTVTHSVSVQDPPTISLVPATGAVVVMEGDTVQIGCIPQGNPTPRITWSMRDGNIPLHQIFLNQTKLTVERVSRRHTGLYVCTADNGVGRPAIGAVYVRVKYAPEIETPRKRVHGGVAYKAQLICIVHADPKPEVRWRFGEKLAPLSERMFTDVQDNIHTLTISSVRHYDFGMYVCEANNSLGYGVSHIEFSGVPNAPIVSRWETLPWTDSTGADGVQVTLFWAVECYSSLIDYRLLFRPVTLQKPSVTSLDNNNEDNHIHKSQAWTELTIPADSSSAFLHSKCFTLRGLQNRSIYETAITARNKYGSSALSSVCYFSTFPNSSSSRQPQITELFQELSTPDAEAGVGAAAAAAAGKIPLPGDGEDIDYPMSKSSAPPVLSIPNNISITLITTVTTVAIIMATLQPLLQLQFQISVDSSHFHHHHHHHPRQLKLIS